MAISFTWLGHARSGSTRPAARGSTSTRSSTATRSAPTASAAGALRPDRGHARPRRPRRRRRRARTSSSAARSSPRSSCAAGSTEQGVADDGMAHSINKGGTRDGRRRQAHADPREPLVAPHPTAVRRRAVRLRHSARGRPDDLLRRRHERVRRHGADRRARTSPDVAVLPIGDHYTMGPDEAAVAARAARRARVRAVPLRDVPAAHRHAGRAARARSAGVEMLAPQPGETIAL